MIAATQLRAEPTQCNFQPMFAQNNTGHLWPGHEAQRRVEGGLRVWSGRRGRPAAVIRFPGGISFPWRRSPTRLTMPGSVAFAPAPDEGVCSQRCRRRVQRRLDHQPGDRAAGAQQKAPQLTFDHSIVQRVRVRRWQREDLRQRRGLHAGPAGGVHFNGPNATLLAAPGQHQPAGRPAGLHRHRRRRGRHRPGARPSSTSSAAGVAPRRHHPAALRHGARRLRWPLRLVRRQRGGLHLQAAQGGAFEAGREEEASGER